MFSRHLTIDVKGVIEDVQGLRGDDFPIDLESDIFYGSDFQGEGSSMDEETALRIESISEGEEEYHRCREEKEESQCPKKQPSTRR